MNLHNLSSAYKNTKPNVLAEEVQLSWLSEEVQIVWGELRFCRDGMFLITFDLGIKEHIACGLA